jgi:hypothetical protein
MLHFRISRVLIAVLCLMLLGAVLLSRAGRLLVVDNAQKSDVAIVLAGGPNDIRVDRGLELLRAGTTRELVFDAGSELVYGQPVFVYAQQYLNRLPADVRAHAHVCIFGGDSTKIELLGGRQCVMAAAPGASKMLLVTSDYHTRRALSIARRVFPQNSWTVASASDPSFGVNWWNHREWAKTCLTEWQKLLWWDLVERWRS